MNVSVTTAQESSTPRSNAWVRFLRSYGPTPNTMMQFKCNGTGVVTQEFNFVIPDEGNPRRQIKPIIREDALYPSMQISGSEMKL